MIGFIAVVDWEDLQESPWYKGFMARCPDRLGKKGEPGPGFWAIDVMRDCMWGPYKTEQEAVAYIVTIIATTRREVKDGTAPKFLH